MELLQSLRSPSRRAVTNLATVSFENGRELAHRTTRKDLARRVQLGQRQVSFFCGNIVFTANIQNHLPGQSWQTAVGMRCADCSVSDDEEVRIVCFGHETLHVQHYCAINPGNICLDRCEDVVEQVVVMNFRVQTLRCVRRVEAVMTRMPLSE